MRAVHENGRLGNWRRGIYCEPKIFRYQHLSMFYERPYMCYTLISSPGWGDVRPDLAARLVTHCAQPDRGDDFAGARVAGTDLLAHTNTSWHAKSLPSHLR